MSDKLSDRLIDSSKDVLQKIIDTDMVQKFVLSGDLDSGKNRAVAQRLYKNLYDLKPFSEQLYQDAIKLPSLKPEEELFFQKMSEQYVPIFSKYLDELKDAVGPVSDEVMSAPIRPMTLEYHKMFTDQIEKGSALHFLVCLLAVHSVVVGIGSYAENSPSYKESRVTKLLTFRAMGAEQAIVAYKAFIDNRAEEENSELESELKNLFRSVMEFQLKATMANYNEA